jgi:uncharacterized phage protein (TIGR01671 family)
MKFRVWDKTIEKMIYNDTNMREIYCKGIWVGNSDVEINLDGEAFIAKYYEYESASYLDNELVLLPSTGLKDKHGKEIYEGDVVKDKFNDVFEVIYLVDFAAFGMEEIGNRTYINFLGRIFTEDKDYYDWEVIGNIYENKELLQE